MLLAINIFQQTILNLVHSSNVPWEFNGEVFQESQHIQQLKRNDFAWIKEIIDFNKLMLSVVFDNPSVGLNYADQINLFAPGLTGDFQLSLLTYYQALSFFASWNSFSDQKKSNILHQVNSNLEQLELFSRHAPMNFQHKYDLVEAEKNRVLGNRFAALELYDRAISGAKENKFIQEEALSNELAAKFYLDWGKEKVAAGYMQEAYYCYVQWGATAKTAHLEKHYPELLRPVLQKNQTFNPLQTLSSLTTVGGSKSKSCSTNLSLNDTFDLTDILSSARVLTEILELDELLKRLSQIILKNSGCDRLILALKDHTGALQTNIVSDTTNSETDTNPSEIELNNPAKLINYVKNTQEVVLVNNLETDLPIIDDYLLEQKPQSLLALPLKHQESTIGVIYLHSTQVQNLFKPYRIIVLEFLCSQAAIAIHNAQLFESASLKSLVIESSVDGMAILEDGKFIYLNHSHASLFGYEIDELLGKSWELLYQPEELKRLKEIVFPIIGSTGKWSGEAIAKRKDGSAIPEELSLLLLEDGKLICICRDISDRKRTEKQQQQLIAILEATPDCIGIADTLGNTVWNNKRMRERLNIDEELESQQVSIASFHPEWVNQLFRDEAFPTAIKEGTWMGETAVIDQTGKEIPMSQVLIAHKNSEGLIENFSTIMRDISDRKQLEQELKNSEARASASFQQAAVGIVESNLETGQFTRTNNYFCEMTGYSRAELLDLTIKQITHPEDLGASKAYIQKLHQGEIDSFTVEKRYLRKDKSIFWAVTTVSLIDLPGEQSRSYLAIIKDISDQKSAEAALLESETYHRNLFEESSIGLHLCRLTGEAIYANSAYSKIIGRSVEELLGLSYWEITPKKYAANEAQQLDLSLIHI